MDAARVAKKLGIPFEVLDLRKEFRELVVADFITEYAAGRTPNPCIRCNERIKFELLLEKAREMGAERLATGHYARIGQDSVGSQYLLAGNDPLKDQSYFLFTLSAGQLGRVLFPVGALEKPAVRGLASRYGLPVAEKHESQEICFIPDNDYIRFLADNGVQQLPGEVIGPDGSVIGRHGGVHRFTVGQRKGLGIAWKSPLHVISLDPANNRVYVGSSEELFRSGLTAGNATWAETRLPGEFRAECRIRYRHTPASCRVMILPDQRFSVNFDEPQKSITPGQAAVLYDGQRVLGGGWIEE